MPEKTLPKYDVTEMKLADLKDNPANPRTIRDSALKGLIASLEQFGLIQPIIWNRRTGYIVGGHQRKKALEAAGYTSAQVLIVDYDEKQETGALMSLNNERIQGEWTDGAADILVEYEELYPDAARELMLHDLKMDLTDGGGPNDGLAAGSPLYSTEEIVSNAFDHFRQTGFPYQTLSRHVALQQMNRLSQMPAELSVRSNLAYHVPDRYNPHRYHERVHAKKSLVEFWADDEWLKKAIAVELEMVGSIGDGYFGMIGSVSGSQSLANFRPGFAMHLYRKYGKPGGVVLDPCTGYGGRLIGWHCSKLGGRYIGVDPSTLTSAGNHNMVIDMGIRGVTLIQKPFEDSLPDIEQALQRTGGGVDFSFTSPPYFSKEKYSEEDTQSWKRYPTIDAWTTGFLAPLFKINALLLNPGAILAINIADVKINSAVIPLEDLTVQCAAAAGLPLDHTLRFDLPQRPGRNTHVFTASEPVFIFRKPA